VAAHLPCVEVPRLGETERLVLLPPFSLHDATTGAPPRLRTAVRVGLRDDALCVRFDGRDDGVVASLTERDAPLWTEDVFEVFLSPHDPPTVYYEFEVNPLGAVFDARVESPDLARKTMRVDAGWTCQGFRARVTLKPNRWSATLRIPLTELAGSRAAAVWRANFFRIDRGPTCEFSAWSATLTDPADFHVPERFGTLNICDL
jgi:cellulose/xylan binding protein with CBM9 domain